MPPLGLITAEPSAEPRMRAMKVPADVAVVGRSEMERLGTLMRPATPVDSVCHMSPALLDEAEAAFARLGYGELPIVAADSSSLFSGLRDHALSWSVRHLRGADARRVVGLHGGCADSECGDPCR